KQAQARERVASESVRGPRRPQQPLRTCVSDRENSSCLPGEVRLQGKTGWWVACREDPGNSGGLAIRCMHAPIPSPPVNGAGAARDETGGILRNRTV
ncbi:unnamed protein product, partial [Ectocarpus sp. 6 AP-2014]